MKNIIKTTEKDFEEIVANTFKKALEKTGNWKQAEAEVDSQIELLKSNNEIQLVDVESEAE